MNWEHLCNDSKLQDLPYKVELNQKGQIIMSPAKLYHGHFQSELSYFLRTLIPHGEVVTGCAIQTRDSTKVADVAWFSNEHWEQIKEAYEASIAPEICVEIVSFSNSQKEMKIKRTLYFEAGAQEFWLCERDEKLRFFDETGEILTSQLVPQFPQTIDL